MYNRPKLITTIAFLVTNAVLIWDTNAFPAVDCLSLIVVDCLLFVVDCLSMSLACCLQHCNGAVWERLLPQKHTCGVPFHGANAAWDSQTSWCQNWHSRVLLVLRPSPCHRTLSWWCTCVCILGLRGSRHHTPPSPQEPTCVSNFDGRSWCRAKHHTWRDHWSKQCHRSEYKHQLHTLSRHRWIFSSTKIYKMESAQQLDNPCRQSSSCKSFLYPYEND